MTTNSPGAGEAAGDADTASAVSGPLAVARTVDRTVAPGRAWLGDPVPIPLGAELIIGREGSVVVGREPLDTGVSRVALVVTPTMDGWNIRCLNRNGVAVHAWAQAPSWLNYGGAHTSLWPRIGLRVVGTVRGIEHWALLENDGYALSLGMAIEPPDGEDTYVVARPRRLTASQTTAAYAVFADFLAWPPTSTPTPRSLESVGQRLGITPSAIRERLKPLQERAQELGLHQQFGVTEPDYIFHLAAHGYLDDLPPTATVGGRS